MTPTTPIGGHNKAVTFFCRAIADNSRLGIFLCPVPSVTRCDLPVELTALLLDNKMVWTKVEASYPGLECPVWW
jgi:dihydrodipicolinate synthase/N-acetylneuraminate lyase